jgi:hypothetical protein
MNDDDRMMTDPTEQNSELTAMSFRPQENRVDSDTALHPRNSGNLSPHILCLHPQLRRP